MTFVLLCPRRGEEVLAAEYQDFLRFAQLSEHELEQRALDTPEATLGDMTGVTGVFIGGSPFTITDPYDEHWQDAVSRKLVDFITSQVEAGEEGIPIFAACYGTAMVAHYLGGKVNASYSETPGVSTAFLTDAGRRDPLTSRITSPFRVMTGHKDSVVELPPNATLLATSPQCPTQMYRLGDTMWASQFHPEMDGDAITRRLSFYEEDGYVDPQKLAATYAAFKGHDTSVSNSLLKHFADFCRERAAARASR
ncbi:glutamine amidotransferase [Corynebacterium sp. 320]|uniref:glutamine amidotransferase-related protein n=1 Tax=Corynebacterium TaxID=1716 RepID=UPI00125CA861|nr:MULTISPECIES: glutamine amidotransferase [Corynebacterium]KAB1503659.1 glutamine amidotransferase [Corynebacterium sp. 320]KAB1553240.1 glutamine amidotransferase [Corynebacterium sp. 321]KAB1553541.1 glutamine amidotransferase [Corynebacterium sp. 319]KAB3527795.1 glutamine amidotransferase [Corynebacterium sp. 250]KAB3540716.1 glutamine amidotransferase [Corynebacterium sp. 366]